MKRQAPTASNFLRLQSHLPDSPHYERSFMHRENLSTLAFSTQNNFLITGSTDGNIKFWKKKDQGLASAANAVSGNSTGSRVNSNNFSDIKQKAKMANEGGEDLTFLGESIEFVKQFRSHIMSVDFIALSKDGNHAGTICTAEQSLKIYDVVNFDMISMFKFKHIRPTRIEFLARNNLDKKIILGVGQMSGRVEFINTEHLRYESRTVGKKDDLDQNGEKLDPTKVLNKGDALDEHSDFQTDSEKNSQYHNSLVKISNSPIVCLKIHPIDNIVILFHLDGSINFLDIDTQALSKTKLKNHPDLYNLQKDKTFALSCDISNNGSKFVVNCQDKSVRIFSYKTGKQIVKFDESVEKLRKVQDMAFELNQKIDERERQDQDENQNQENQQEHEVRGRPMMLDLMEFEQRIISETKLDKEIKSYTDKSLAPPVHLCSSVHFYSLAKEEILVYPCMVGVRIFSLLYKKLVISKPLGIADNLRHTQLACAFEPIQVGKKAMTMESLLANNPALRATDIIDPIIFTVAHNKNRFYLYSQRECNENDRDIFNEKPTAEEMLAAQKGEETKRIGEEAILHTSYGDIYCKLYGNECPKTVENFTVHSRNGYYNGMCFHRIIKNFMIQTGCPLGTGRGGESIWGGDFEDEFHPTLNHSKPYMLSMANAGPNTNGSQFFITVAAASYLDGKHTVFGRVIKGMNVAQMISQVKTRKTADMPLDEIKLISVTVKLRKFK